MNAALEAGVHESSTEGKTQPTVDLSVIIPVSERFDDVREVYETYKHDLDKTGRTYEIIYVLDGQYPDVLGELRRLVSEGEPLRIICFARAFGEATALTAGFVNSDGPLIVTLPAYHQVEPGAAAQLVNALDNTDMVVLRRWPRRDSAFNRLQTRLFYKLQKFITGHQWQDLGCSARGFKRQVIEEVSVYGDQHRFLPFIAQYRGFRVKELDHPQSSSDRYRRVYKPGVYLRRLLDLLTVFFLSKFTKKPLRFYGLIGSAIAFLGILISAWVVVERLFFGTPLAQRPALLLGSLFIVLGIQIFGLGLIGELIIFTRARELKEYIIEEVIN
jgi:glycosyltransferase involved in cell wall biosynthesis